MQEIVVLDVDSTNVFQPDLKALGLDSLPLKRLSPNAGLALGEADRVYFFATMMNGFLRYQQEMVEENRGVAQWVFVVWSRDRLIEDAIRNGLEEADVSFHVLLARDMPAEEMRVQIDGISAVRLRSCLIYSKRPDAGKETLKTLLSDHYCTKWSFEIREGPEEELWEGCIGAQKVIIVGSRPDDFSLCKPEALDTIPIFFYNRMDESVQRCLNRDALWKEIRAYLLARDWKLPINNPDFFVGSALYEGWALEGGGRAGDSLANRDGFVMWDRYGLPVPKKDYTSDRMQGFLERFQEIMRIGERINGEK